MEKHDLKTLREFRWGEATATDEAGLWRHPGYLGAYTVDAALNICERLRAQRAALAAAQEPAAS